ncbi:MAG: hypothetical protein OEY41_06130 [Acidimicrobiia bacterium]|nr:hypothetical protein [Acidimicrobiia bacterium]
MARATVRRSMMRRLFGLWAVRRLLGGGGRAWMITWGGLVGFRLARRVVGAQPRIERLELKPGQHLTLDQLPISHRRQIKQFKAADRSARKADRARTRAARREAAAARTTG